MRTTLIASALASLLLAGCATTQLTKENYEKLKTGMSHDEVTAILGKASNCKETKGINTCSWGRNDAKTVTVLFVEGKATAFSYKDPQ